MRIVLIVILVDIFIFTIGAMFADKKHKIIDSKIQSHYVDRYGYSWKVEK